MSESAESQPGTFWGDADADAALQRYRTLVNTVDDGIYQLDAEGHFVGVNDKIVENTGYSREELLGEHVSLVLDESEIERIKRDFRERLEVGDDIDGVTYETTVETVDGELLTCELQISLLISDGEFRGSIGIVRDVTERKRYERHLESKLDEIYGRITDGFFALNEAWEFTHVNERAESILGSDAEELLGTEIWEAFPEAAGTEFEEQYREAMATQEPVSFEEYYPEPLDTWFEVRAYPSETGLSVYFQDVTDRKRRERQLAESEQRYRTLAECFPNGVVTLFDDDLRYTLAAGRAFDDLPVSQEDVEGHLPRQAWGDDVADALEPAMEATLSGEERSIEAEYDGREWAIHAVPVTDDEGEAFAGMTMAQDISERKERERELERTRDLLKRTERIADVGGWEIDTDTMDVFWTEHIFDLLDVPDDEAPSLDEALDMYHEDDQAIVQNAIEEALTTGDPFDVEARIQTNSGELRWLRLQGVPEMVDNEIVSLRGAAQDITGRKERERELETLFEVLPVGVIVADDDGQIVEANDTAREIWGGDLLRADSVEEYEKFPVWWADSDERATPEEMTLARVLDGEEVTEPDVFEIEAFDGKRRIIQAKGMPIWNERGEVARSVVTISDVTERKEAQRKLAESERRYRTLVENFPNGSVGLFDEELRYTAVGGQLMDTFDMDPEDRIGKTIPELHPPDLVEEIEPYFRAALEGEANSFELEYRGRYLHAHTLPVRNAADDIFAGMLVVQDITERKEYERKLEESNERLEQFAYAASHDLQEPLRMVSSYLQLIEDRYADELDEDGEEFLEYAVNGADRMRDMIEALLQYSRVDTRGDPFEPIDLDAVLADARDDLQVKIEESDAKITAESLPRVEGDADQLRQVFQNLLDNAIEYSGDEPPRVHISAERRSTHRDEWVISVSDEGIGFDPDDADRVFEVFQSLHAQGEYDGTGIGLALCERIVERHGGDIWAESEPDEGTTVSFTLPAAGDGDA